MDGVRLTGQLLCPTADDVRLVAEHLPEHVRLTRAEAGCRRFDVVLTGDGRTWQVDEEFDSPEAAFQPFFDARHQVGLAIIDKLNAEGIALAYPTQTEFSAPEEAVQASAWPAPPAS